MDIIQRYEEIIDGLKKGQRYLEKLTAEEVQYLNDQLLTENNLETIEQILCIITNTQTETTEFTKSIIKLLMDNQITNSVKIFALNAAQKHIISANNKKGKRAPADFLMILQTLLKSKDIELIEWCLRIIDELGSQAIFFKNDLKDINFGISSLFNKHKRHVIGLKTMLERKWKHG